MNSHAWGAAAWLATWLATISSAWAVEPVLAVNSRVDRAEAWLHEQVVFEVHVQHRLFARPRWEAPVCEGFWVERMPSEGGALLYPGGREAARTTVFRRALFPTRSGRLEIPASILRVHDEDDEEREVSIPGAHVVVRALPDADRPPDFTGLVGTLELRVTTDGDEVVRGRSLGVEIDVFGTANVWDVARPDLSALIEPESEVFPERPRLLTSSRSGRLFARRRFRFDVVASESGRHAIAPIALSYFDPERAAYAVARSATVEFMVAKARALPQRAPWEARRRAGRVRLNPALVIPMLGIFALLLVVSGWLLARWWRGAESGSGRTRPDPRVLLERAEQAEDPSTLPVLIADAVRAAVYGRHGLDPEALTTAELATRIQDEEALSLLQRLDDARFGGAIADGRELLAAARAYLDSP